MSGSLPLKQMTVYFSLKDYAEKVNEIEEDDVWNMIVDLTMVGNSALSLYAFEH